jgi:hypothetical protein
MDQPYIFRTSTLICQAPKRVGHAPSERYCLELHAAVVKTHPLLRTGFTYALFPHEGDPFE